MRTKTYYAIVSSRNKYILNIHPTKKEATEELKRWDSEFYKIVKMVETLTKGEV
jgi:benzoyl-CoA reductase/2-hydroxyglutaryl-CoA dehydratase subunit BcrC/BadD/HgdB